MAVDKDKEQVMFEDMARRVAEARKTFGVDLSTDEDLSFGVMNLVSLEEHFFMTGEKTGKPEYFNLLNEVRQARKTAMERLLPKEKHEGETWCVSKHLLAAAMRFMEVGTKLQQEGKKAEAKEFFDRAYRLYTMFWGLRLKLTDIKGLKAAAANEQPWTLQNIVDKLVNCCDE